MIQPQMLQGDEKILFNRALELKENWQSRGKPGFSAFLNLREQEIVSSALGLDAILFGGYQQAERKILGVFDTEKNITFPIKAIELKTPAEIKLNHRWVLGSLVGLGISRGAIGDIIPDYGKCAVICTTTIEPFLLQELKKVGSYIVKPCSASLDKIVPTNDFKDISGTISSIRLDSLVALITNQSRTKCQNLFVSGKVQINHKVEHRLICDFKEQDIITVQGFGKFIVDNIGIPTKKGRIPINCRKYI